MIETLRFLVGSTMASPSSSRTMELAVLADLALGGLDPLSTTLSLSLLLLPSAMSARSRADSRILSEAFLMNPAILGVSTEIGTGQERLKQGCGIGEKCLNI